MFGLSKDGKKLVMASAFLGACVRPPGAEDLTSEDYETIEADLELEQQIRPIVEAMYAVSDANVNENGETVPPEEAAELIGKAAERFRDLLAGGQVVKGAADHFEGRLFPRRELESGSKDWIYLNKDSFWGPDLYVHEGVHSIGKKDARHDDGVNDYLDLAQEHETSYLNPEFTPLVISEGDAAYVTSTLYAFVERVVSRMEGVARYEDHFDSWQGYSNEAFAEAVIAGLEGNHTTTPLYEDYNYVKIVEGLGVDRNELLTIFSSESTVEVLKEIQREHRQEFLAEQQAESRREMRGPARR